MKHGVFINQRKANCSIYESGLVIKDILKGYSKEYSIDYIETDGNLTGYNWHPYSFHIINWHPHTLAIGSSLLAKLRNKIAIVVEVSPDNYIPFTPEWFDAYAIIDPTKKRVGKFFPLPRPILRFPTRHLLDDDKLAFGSFGLYSQFFPEEKKFGEIVIAANESGRDCIVRINLPYADFTYTPMKNIVQYGKWLKSLAKSNVEVIITHEYMSREDLVGWLSEHNINCFPYYRNRPGLSAVTDQAIAAGRGIMTTECDTFRHIHQNISHYPDQSYTELATSTVDGVLKMRDEWSPENFRIGFDNMLKELGII